MIYNFSSASTSTTNYVVMGISANAVSNNQIVSANTVYNLNSIATTAGVPAIGIYYSGPTFTGNNFVERNTIHSISLSTSSTSGSIYGILINANTRASVRNNMIRLGINASGASISTGYLIIGIYDVANAIANYHYNSVYIGGTGVATGNASYAFLSAGTSSGRTFTNNIFWNARSNASASTPKHYAYYLVSTASSLVSDYNILLATGLGKIMISENSVTDYNSLSAWRTAKSLDNNSFSAYPQFINPTGNSSAVNLHINAAAATLAESNGIGIATIINDVDNDARSGTATPPTGTDIGADEGTFTAVATRYDVGVSAFVSPGTSNCVSGIQNVTVTITNYRAIAVPAGTPINITFQLTGAGTSTLSTSYTGGIAASGTANVTLGTVDLSALGTYTLRAYTSGDGIGNDIDVSNDEATTSRTTAALTAGSISLTSGSLLYCVTGGIPGFTISGNAGGDIQWQSSTISDSGPWTDVGTINSTTYTAPSAITTTTHYRAKVSCSGTDEFTNVLTAQLVNPVLTSATGASKCGPGEVSLSASTSTPGAIINWYASSSGGSVLGTGTTFSPYVTGSTTYYAAAEVINGTSASATFGTATNVNTINNYSSTDYPSPYNNWYGGTKHQMMIRASELTAAGVTAGNITSLTFTLVAMGSTLASNPVLQDFRIEMKATTNTTLNASSFETGLTNVLSQRDITLPTSGPVNVTHPFDVPFTWDGTSNIVIQTAYSNDNLGSSSTYVTMYYSNPGFLSTIVARKDYNTIDDILNITATDYSYSNRRPNMSITFNPTCASPRLPAVVTYTAPPALALSATSASICSGSSTSVNVTAGTIGNYDVYDWTPSGDITLAGTPSGSTVTFNSTDNTTYTLNASNTISGCVNSATVAITVNPTPNSFTGTGYSVCQNGTIPGGSGLQGSGLTSISTLSGTLTTSDPTYIRSIGTGVGTLGTYSAGNNVYYHTLTLQVSTTGSYTFNACGFGTFTDTHASLYVNSFNPASPATNFMIANDDGNGSNCTLGSRITATLTQGTTYILVTSTYSSLVTLSYTWDFTGAGNVLTGPPNTNYKWYTASTGGTAIGTGAVFNPVGVLGSGVANTATAGAYTFYLANNNGTCESTRVPVVLTIQPNSVAPTAVLANGVNPLNTCSSAGNVSLTQTGGVLGQGATWRWYSNAAFTTLVGTSTAADAALTITQAVGTTTYYLRAEGATCGTATVASGASVAVTVNANGTWLGITNDWTNSSNWCGGVPTSSTNVVIPTSSNNPTIASGTYAVNNISFTGTGQLNISSGATLQVAGAISSTNAISAAAGTIEMIGASPQTFAGNNFNTKKLGTLVLSNPDVTLSAAGDTLKIVEALSFGNLSNATFNTNNLLTLVSTATGTARIADVTNNDVRSGNTLNGKVIIERYIPARRSWRLLTAPVQTTGAPTISASWQEGGRTTVPSVAVDPQPTYGMYVTYGPNQPGYDQGINNNSSLFYMTNLGWRGVPSATNGTTPGLNQGVITDQPGYMVFVRGDRSINLAAGAYATPNPTILRVSGNINITPNPASPSSFTASGGYAGFNVVPNPYPSSINYHKVATLAANVSAGLPDAFYQWDPSLTGSNGVGGWVALTYNSGNGNYDRSVVGSINNTGDIQSGSAFIVNYTGVVRFKETHKVSGSNLTPFRGGKELRTSLYAYNSDGTTSLNDGTLITFNQAYSNLVDGEDMIKLTNFNENISIQKDTQILVIERRQPLGLKDTVFYNISGMKAKTYKLEISMNDLGLAPGTEAYLEDRFLNISTPVALQDTTRIDFTVTSTAGSYSANRFRLVFKTIGGAPVPVTISKLKAYKQQRDIAVEWTVENEINITKYEIEKSADGRNFIKVNTTTAVANNLATYTYNWLDVQPFTGDNYYRIRSYNASGTSTYSRIVKVNIAGLDKGIVVYPNPVTDGQIGVQLKQMQAGVYVAKLTNALGQIVSSKQFTHSGGTAIEVIKPAVALSNGTYQLEITAPDKTTSTINVLVHNQ
ncbi:MAG: beta strand repeat-containing protein [Ferruginibacter sp.]